MTHQTTLGNVVPALAVMVLTGTLLVMFTRKRMQTSVNALDWLMAIFGATSLLGFMQVLKYYLHDSTSFFVPDSYPSALDVVTVLNLVIILILYLMVESFLAERPNPIRLSLVSAAVTLFFSLAIYFNATGNVLLTSDVFSFAQDTTFDSLIFDLVQVGVVSLVFYTFAMQRTYSENETVQQYLLILLLAIGLFLLTALIEFMENFFPIADVSAFLFALPTFVILAWFYLKNSNFIYLAPANIAFLQIVKSDGTLVYAAELSEDLKTSDFLVAPSLTSVSSIISELVSSEKKLELKQFVYTGGYILFEQHGQLQAILQTDRPSAILKRSMRYFLREFNRLYADQVDNYKGYIEESNGIDPDTLFSQAIPIVMSKAMSSSFNNTDDE